MKTPLKTYTEVKDELSKFGEPPPGYVRVFRGQTRDHGCMLPSGLRPGAIRRDPVWDYCVTQFAMERFGAANLGSLSEHEIVAIAQHYGVGSPFLDVTRSLDVALWFALHQIRYERGDHFGWMTR
jgi:FRG domain-containing protein